MGRFLKKGNGSDVAILNGNYPAFNCLSPYIFVCYQELVEDTELNRIAGERMRQRHRLAE
ncbi:plasmid stabilization protein [Aeromonas hydrophila]|uniref:Uncharacterized protein n=1 Tax=Aeromonas hydrophila TaxID=644 RepID=A0ABD7G5N7_AERHY|nr:hypothetical protein C6C11_15395 [Aeromonas hydrophila]TNH84659.1 plasmid stabilization protein [Aeromonas hydrophila]TNH98437.1 plasmid stabilization protein [Aeromonas hydrophila]TNI96429.1 plasmid stabilization protein [Aeromonas hydrophila]